MILTRTLLILALTVEAAAIAMSAFLLVDAARDLDAVTREQVANGRRLVAETSCRSEILRLVALVALAVSTGTAAVYLWDAPPPAGSTILTARWALLVAAAALLAQSVTVHGMRRRLFDTYRDDRPDPADPLPTEADHQRIPSHETSPGDDR